MTSVEHQLVSRFVHVKKPLDEKSAKEVRDRLYAMAKPELDKWPIVGDISLRVADNRDGSKTVIMEVEVMR